MTILKESCTPNRVFLVGLQLLVVLTLIQLPQHDGEAFYSLLLSDVNDTYMDFFNSIYDAVVENPYVERGVIYPPLTYLYYRLCALLLPAGCTAQQWKVSQSGLVLVTVTTFLSMAMIYKVLLPEENENSKQSRSLVLWCLLATVPFWYAIERGNLILLTLAALAYFIKHRKSENIWKRELALISLAIATSFKIYPAFFGLLLLVDKQYKEAVRCIIYGVVLFFVPFLFFDGLSSLRVMIQNYFSTNNKIISWGWGYKENIDNTIAFLSEALHTPLPNAKIINLLFALMTAIVFIRTKKQWQRYMALCTVMILFPKFSYAYALVIAVIPLLAFLQELPESTTRNLLFSFLFLCMFAPFPFGGYGLFDAAPSYPFLLNLTTVISSFAILGMVILMMIDVIFCRIQNRFRVERGSVKGESAQVRFMIAVAIILVVFCAWYVYCDNLYKIAMF